PDPSRLEPEHGFGDDVSLDLVGSAVDAELARVQIFLGRGVAVVGARHEVVGADRMLAYGKSVIADRAMGELGDVLHYLGAAELEQRGRRTGIYAARQPGNG